MTWSCTAHTSIDRLKRSKETLLRMRQESLEMRCADLSLLSARAVRSALRDHTAEVDSAAMNDRLAHARSGAYALKGGWHNSR